VREQRWGWIPWKGGIILLILWSISSWLHLFVWQFMIKDHDEC
jgi:hypothetical protein